MKSKAVFILVALLIFVAHSANGQSPLPDRNFIATEGEGEVTGRNDSARVFISVVTEGRKLVKVSEDNALKTKKVLTALKGLKIGKLKLKTSGYRVTPQRDYKARPVRIMGYEVQNTVAVSLEGFMPEQLSMHLSRIVGKALEKGANSVQTVQLYIRNKEPLEREALTLATRKAMDRVKVLAEAAGVKLKRLVSLRAHHIKSPAPLSLVRRTMMKAEGSAMAPPIEIGESVIRARVEVVYEIK